MNLDASSGLLLMVFILVSTLLSPIQALRRCSDDIIPNENWQERPAPPRFLFPPRSSVDEGNDQACWKPERISKAYTH